MTAALFDALTEKLSELFVHYLERPYPNAPINEQYAAGVRKVLAVTEILEPIYGSPENCDLEVTYVDGAGGERTYYFGSMRTYELVQGMEVSVPPHKLTWTLEAP